MKKTTKTIIVLLVISNLILLTILFMQNTSSPSSLAKPTSTTYISDNGSVKKTNMPTSTPTQTLRTTTTKASQPTPTRSSSSYSSYGTSSFTNKYGTRTTKCVISGCSNYIASSGDTNCCVSHSNRCLECRKYIDGDAAYCMDCILGAFGY